MEKRLGVLKILSLRNFWSHEALDFTPWLAQHENIAKLSSAIGVDLQIEQTEVPVGPYSADMLAIDASGAYVVIESQFNKTDHDHLGKLITYGATLNAKVLIWIAEKFTDEHRKAIQWLNDQSIEDLSIYAVEPELLQIDNSPPAIRFNVVAQPNEVVKAATLAKAAHDLSEAQKLQLEFWTLFRKYILEKKIVTSAQTARPQYWFDVPLGRSGIHLSNTLNTFDGRIGVRVYISNRIVAAALPQLLAQRNEIQKEIGADLQWDPNPDNRDKIIALFKDVDLGRRDQWPLYLDWLAETLEKFIKAFRPRVANLDLETPTSEHEV